MVTGAAGFIGFHVARQLLANGREVVGADSVNAYYDPKLKEARIELLKRDPKFPTDAKLVQRTPTMETALF